jgi:hypothetical protein
LSLPRVGALRCMCPERSPPLRGPVRRVHRVVGAALRGKVTLLPRERPRPDLRVAAGTSSHVQSAGWASRFAKRRALERVVSGVPSGRLGWSGQRLQVAQAIGNPRWKAGLQGDDLVGPVRRMSSVSADETGRCRWWWIPWRASVRVPVTGRVAMTETAILVWVTSPREHRAFVRGNTSGAQRTRRWSKALRSVAVYVPYSDHPFAGDPDAARQQPDDEREEVAVTRHGCRRGESFEGRLRLGEIESQAGRSPVRLFGGGGCSGRSGSSKETRRTPRSAAGCNKPARYRAEKTVGAGRNGKGGTSPERGNSGPKVAAREESSFGTKRHDRSPSLLFGALGRRTVTRRGRSMLMSTEGRSLDNPKRGIPIRP